MSEQLPESSNPVDPQSDSTNNVKAIEQHQGTGLTENLRQWAKNWYEFTMMVFAVVGFIVAFATAMIYWSQLETANKTLEATLEYNKKQIEKDRDQRNEQANAAAAAEQEHQRLLRHRLIQDSIAYSSKIDDLLVRNPEMRKYFHGGIPVPRPSSEFDKFESMADTVIDTFDMVLFSMDLGEWPGKQGWLDWMTDIFASSPSLREYYAEHKHWYGGNAALNDVYERGLAKAHYLKR